MEDFSYVLSNYLSPNSMVRASAEAQMNRILMRGDPNDLDPLFEALNKDYDPQVKLFLALLIKKVFESSIGEQNINYFTKYVVSRKAQIVNTILNLKADLKSVNILVIVLEKCMSIFNDSNDPNLGDFNPEEVFQYIFQFYNYNKQNSNIQETFQGLYISFKLLKMLKTWEKDKFDFQNIFSKFYDKICVDFSEILFSFLSILDKLNQNNLNNLNSTLSQTEINELLILIQYITLYLKIAKHSVNFLQKEQREKIMDLTFQFLIKVLFNLNFILQQGRILDTSYNLTNSDKNIISEYNKNIFESIFLSNKILLKYTGYVSKIDIFTIKKFSDLFYLYISENSIFENIIQIIRMNSNNLNTNKNNTYKEHKFITDIIDFFKELLQLTSFDNWGDLVLFKDCFCDDSIAISDFLIKEFFTEERIKILVIFAIKNCMIFHINEIDMAINDIEEFYIWYDTLSPIYDLREKAGLLCRIIYDKYKKNLREFFESLERNLLNLTEKEFQQGGLDFNETNLKCAILYFFENLTYLYFNKHRNYEIWVKKIFLQPLDLENFKNPNSEIFSKFIILRILMKTVDFKEISNYKPLIFDKIYNLFINLNQKANNNYLLLKLGALDFFYAFFDDFYVKECPDDFLKNSIIHICDMLRNVSSPDIHNKIIKTTLTILDKFKDEEIEFAFPYIFPVLKILWENNWNDYEGGYSYLNLRKKSGFQQQGNIIGFQNSNQNSISVVRQNLIKLISIFVKKIGIFITFNNQLGNNTLSQNCNSIVDLNYFQFIYNIIGYSISVKSKESNFLVQEALKLILLIQDEFYKLNCINKNLSPQITNKPDEFFLYFQFYFKFYDFFPIILENLAFSDDFFLAQLLITEQYLSIGYLPEVSNYLLSIGVVEKLIFITQNLFEKHIKTLTQPIFNFIEFCHYILNFINYVNSIPNSNSNIQLPVGQYNNFVQQIVQKIFLEFNAQSILSTITTSLHNCEESNLKIDFINLPECVDFNLFLGALQISNRLIYINLSIFNNLEFGFYYALAEYLNFMVNNKILMDGLSILNRKILLNLIKNLIKIFTANGYTENEGNLKNLLKTFDESSGHFLDKYNHTLNHWLFFFNKMNNNTYYYHFTALEENLRHFWSQKLEKLNYFEVDLSNINFDFKYYSLLNDEMYKNQCGEDEQNGEDDNL